MSLVPLIFIILGSLFNILDGSLWITELILGARQFSVPDFISISSLSLQVLFYLLAIISSVVNLLKNRTNRLFNFLFVVASSALFFGSLFWLISWLPIGDLLN